MEQRATRLDGISSAHSLSICLVVSLLVLISSCSLERGKLCPVNSPPTKIGLLVSKNSPRVVLKKGDFNVFEWVRGLDRVNPAMPFAWTVRGTGHRKKDFSTSLGIVLANVLSPIAVLTGLGEIVSREGTLLADGNVDEWFDMMFSDTTAPTLRTATATGASLWLTYDETLNRTTPAKTAFTIDNSASGGLAQRVSDVRISGTTVKLTLNPGVVPGNEPTVTYVVPATNPIEDSAGNKAEKLAKRAVSSPVADTTGPTLITATVRGTSLVLAYDEALDIRSTPAIGDFRVTNSGQAQTVSQVVVTPTAVTLTLAKSVASGDTVTMDYTVGANPIQDIAGNDAKKLINEAVYFTDIRRMFMKRFLYKTQNLHIIPLGELYKTEKEFCPFSKSPPRNYAERFDALLHICLQEFRLRQEWPAHSPFQTAIVTEMTLSDVTNQDTIYFQETLILFRGGPSTDFRDLFIDPQILAKGFGHIGDQVLRFDFSEGRLVEEKVILKEKANGIVKKQKWSGLKEMGFTFGILADLLSHKLNLWSLNPSKLHMLGSGVCK